MLFDRLDIFKSEQIVYNFELLSTSLRHKKSAKKWKRLLTGTIPVNNPLIKKYVENV